MLSVTPRIDSTWQRFAITILNERLSPSSCGIEKLAICSECAARITCSKTARTCGAFGPEHVVEPLAGELAGLHAEQLLRTTGSRSG